MTSILIVDDEQAFLDSVVRMLRIEGYENLHTASDPTTVPAILEKQSFDAVFLDVTMPGMDGLDLLHIIKEKSPRTECIMITAHDSIPLVIKAIKLGAYDYMVKPITPEQLTHALDRALERQRLLESLRLRSETAAAQTLKQPQIFSGIITGNTRMLRLLHEAELHASSDIPVLITGETGVGKELLARAIHDSSRRKRANFVPVNMLALSPSLFESEFFGHIKGSFTGADRDKKGYMSQAESGTLFLDEIGDLSLEIQGKLLRILQEGEFTAVGATRPQAADLRFVAATNQDLEKMVQQRQFRKDLFYRLQFAHLHLPPLRERRDDIPLLAEAFIKNSLKPQMHLHPEATDLLTNYAWPGNIRELKGVMEASVNLAEKGVITPRELRIKISPTIEKAAPTVTTGETITFEPLETVERRHILQTYEALDNNKSRTARVLGIGLQTLHRKLKAYGTK